MAFAHQIEWEGKQARTSKKLLRKQPLNGSQQQYEQHFRPKYWKDEAFNPQYYKFDAHKELMKPGNDPYKPFRTINKSRGSPRIIPRDNNLNGWFAYKPTSIGKEQDNSRVKDFPTYGKSKLADLKFPWGDMNPLQYYSSVRPSRKIR